MFSFYLFFLLKSYRFFRGGGSSCSCVSGGHLYFWWSGSLRKVNGDGTIPGLSGEDGIWG